MSPRLEELVEGFSLEMTGRDVPGLLDAVPALPLGTRVNVTFLGNEDLAMRLAAAKAIIHNGLEPVPHIAARRIASREQFVEFLGALSSQGCADSVFVVGGDPHEPMGPYEESLALIRSGLFAEHGVSNVGFGGYPEGHPHISEDKLWSALTAKAGALREQGLDGTIITQFGFDTEPVFAWVERVRQAGIDLPIRIGVPGPAGVRRLLSFARRFGVESSAGIARKYGFSLTNLLGTAGPNRFIDHIAAQYDPDRHGQLKLHFYTFGGLPATAEWVRSFVAETVR